LRLKCDGGGRKEEGMCRGTETSLCLLVGPSPIPVGLNNGLRSSFLRFLHIAQSFK
jgi:hypothetical protein